MAGRSSEHEDEGDWRPLGSLVDVEDAGRPAASESGAGSTRSAARAVVATGAFSRASRPAGGASCEWSAPSLLAMLPLRATLAEGDLPDSGSPQMDEMAR